MFQKKPRSKDYVANLTAASSLAIRVAEQALSVAFKAQEIGWKYLKVQSPVEHKPNELYVVLEGVFFGQGTHHCYKVNITVELVTMANLGGIWTTSHDCVSIWCDEPEKGFPKDMPGWTVTCGEHAGQRVVHCQLPDVIEGVRHTTPVYFIRSMSSGHIGA